MQAVPSYSLMKLTVMTVCSIVSVVLTSFPRQPKLRVPTDRVLFGSVDVRLCISVVEGLSAEAGLGRVHQEVGRFLAGVLRFVAVR